MLRPDIQLGTILVHSIGFGCDIYYQVMHRTPKRLKVRMLQGRLVNRNIKMQTYDILPTKGKFQEGVQYEYVTLGINGKGQIGPSLRLQWWKVWDGKQLPQWSP